MMFDACDSLAYLDISLEVGKISESLSIQQEQFFHGLLFVCMWGWGGGGVRATDILLIAFENIIINDLIYYIISV